MTMDMWSDPNLSPFMAVTAHWIEAVPIQTPAGRQFKLNLRSDLFAFLSVPGVGRNQIKANLVLECKWEYAH